VTAPEGIPWLLALAGVRRCAGRCRARALERDQATAEDRFKPGSRHPAIAEHLDVLAASVDLVPLRFLELERGDLHRALLELRLVVHLSESLRSGGGKGRTPAPPGP
jgi:hypothetical protein